MTQASSSNPIDQRCGDDLQNISRRVRDFYEECSFPGYEDTDSPHLLAAKAERSVFARLLDEQIPPGCRVLDAGCGTGQLALFLSLTERKVAGVDFSRASLLKGANFKKKFEQRNAVFAQMDLLSPALRDDTFDYVICTGVLHHTADPYRGFRGLCRLAKPGGYLIIGLYNRYARWPLDARRVLFRITRGLRWLDYVMRQPGLSEPKKTIWFRDQYQNPHELKMSVADVLTWFARNDVDYINSIPNIRLGARFSPEEQLFEPQDAGSPLGHWLKQLSWLLTNSREGGFFIMIGRRRERASAR